MIHHYFLILLINISTGEGSILEPIIVNGSISFVIVKMVDLDILPDPIF